MRKILLGVSMFVCLFACKNPKSNIDSFRSISAMVDSARSGQVDTLVAEPVEEAPKPIEADELFDDFIFIMLQIQHFSGSVQCFLCPIIEVIRR